MSAQARAAASHDRAGRKGDTRYLPALLFDVPSDQIVPGSQATQLARIRAEQVRGERPQLGLIIVRPLQSQPDASTGDRVFLPVRDSAIVCKRGQVQAIGVEVSTGTNVRDREVAYVFAVGGRLTARRARDRLEGTADRVGDRLQARRDRAARSDDERRCKHRNRKLSKHDSPPARKCE